MRCITSERAVESKKNDASANTACMSAKTRNLPGTTIAIPGISLILPGPSEIWSYSFALAIDLLSRVWIPAPTVHHILLDQDRVSTPSSCTNSFGNVPKFECKALQKIYSPSRRTWKSNSKTASRPTVRPVVYAPAMFHRQAMLRT